MNKTKKYLVALITTFLFMFFWIFLTVFLTGEREISDFTQTDKIVFSIFITVEIITIVVMFIFGLKLGQELNINRIKNSPAIQQPQTEQERKMQKHGLMIFLISIGCAVVFYVLGYKLLANKSDIVTDISSYVFNLSCNIPLIFLVLSPIMKKRYIKKYNNKSIKEVQNIFLVNRKNAEQAAERKLNILTALIRISDLYAVVFFILGILVSLCSGVAVPGMITFVFFYTIFLFTCALSRIRFPIREEFFQADDIYVHKNNFPRIYALAEKARKALGCKGDIIIAIISDSNAAIKKIGNTYAVYIGAQLLSTFSEEEMFSVLIHEFSHVAGETAQATQQRLYMDWLISGGNRHIFSQMTNLMYQYIDSVFSFEYDVYRYATSILWETKADADMVRFMPKQIVASALLKLKFQNLYIYETRLIRNCLLYGSEELRPDYIKNEITSYENLYLVRANDWIKLTKSEILSNDSSHPTTKMRLENLGIVKYSILDNKKSSDYFEECEKAIDFIDQLIYRQHKERYAEYREAMFLKPKATIEQWEQNNMPVISEEYGEIVDCLGQLGRLKEAEKLCDKVIATLPRSAQAHACYVKGNCMLQRYDPEGINYIYQALENNHNYIETGLGLIGEFCCLVGNKEELDKYREKVYNLVQKNKDEYSLKYSLNKKDNLSKEKLPDGLLDDILYYIQTVEEAEIAKIYLIRKTISKTFFSSIFIVRFFSYVSIAREQEILNKILCYLDTCSDREFSLFNYRDVQKVNLNKIDGSCVYENNI